MENKTATTQDKGAFLIVESLVNTLQSMLKRQQNVQDPVTRYVMMVDKLAFVIDMSTAMLKNWAMSQLIDYKMDVHMQNTVDNAEDVTITLQHELDNLMKWIQTPHFSPDHPMGQQLMSQSKQEFDSIK